MFIFIGGPPRVGKTTIARKLAKRLKCSWLSTDDLRHLLMETGNFPEEHSIFKMVNLGEWDKRSDFYKKYSPGEIIKFQNTESEEVAKIVCAFIEALQYHKRSFILEGVALFPIFYSRSFVKKYSVKFCCVGNTDYKSFIDYSWKNRSVGDWLEDEDRVTFERVIKYCSKFSKIFQKEARIRKLPYFEIHSPNFDNDIQEIITYLTRGN